MLHAFSTNRLKLVARKPKETDNLGQGEYVLWAATHVLCVRNPKLTQAGGAALSPAPFGTRWSILHRCGHGTLALASTRERKRRGSR